MIGVITYDRPHRKTQDLVFRLRLNGYDVSLIIVPFEERKKFVPIFRHRPYDAVDIDVYDFCERMDLHWTAIADVIWDRFSHVLIGGANILDKSITDKVEIINSHPGYLPNVKGLDALKWAIYNGQPIGVTTHYITENVDDGRMLERRIIPVYFEDTFHSVAQRVYETEIDMLVNSISLSTSFTESGSSSYKSHRRMPHHKEIIMMQRFNEIRKKSKSYIK